MKAFEVCKVNVLVGSTGSVEGLQRRKECFKPYNQWTAVYDLGGGITPIDRRLSYEVYIQCRSVKHIRNALLPFTQGLHRNMMEPSAWCFFTHSLYI